GGTWIECAGGYSDMVAQRGRGVEAKATPRPRGAAEKVPAGVAKPQARAAGKKLSFHDQHALKTLPARMDALGMEIARLQALLDDPGLYARDPAAFTRHSEALADAHAELAAAEERWL